MYPLYFKKNRLIVDDFFLLIEFRNDGDVCDANAILFD